MQGPEIVIVSATEFLKLCASDNPLDTQRSISDTASQDTWDELIKNHRYRWIDIAQNRTIPAEIVRFLATCDDSLVRAVIAENRNIPLDLFSELSKDVDEIVRRKIASNGKTPDEVLFALTSDLVESVASVAAYNWKRRSKAR